MDQVRYGVIGAGLMGREHIANVNALPGVEVTAVADPHEASRDAAGAVAESTVSVFADYREMLDADVCDALVVATPNMTHIDVLRDVLLSDVAVLVEKPMCTTIDDCLEVVELSANRNGLVWVGLEYRYMAPVAHLLAELATGVAGRLQMVAIREHRFPFLEKVGNWNRLSRNTGGTLVEKCCHFFDLMSVIAGARPMRVMASGGQNVNHLEESYEGEHSDILDNAYVIVEYDNGVRGLLDLCMFAEATHNQEEISVVGHAGKLEALIPEDIIRVGRRGEHRIGHVETRGASSSSVPYQGLHHGSSYIENSKFVEAFRSGGEPEVDVMDGLMSVAVGVAAHRSIELGRPVLMSELI